MRNKLYWGLGVLAVLLIGVALGLLIRPTNKETITIYRGDIEPSKEVVDQMRHKISKQKPTARPGYKIVPHGDHYHEVPISENPVFQDAPVSQPAVPKTESEPKTQTGALPYTTPMLETDPAGALRQQSADRGHWSAQWIPTFPPDDTEALTMARDVFILVAHVSRGNKYYDGPAASAWENVEAMQDKYLYAYGQRKDDIFRLTWPLLDTPPFDPETFGVMGWKKVLEREKRSRNR